MNFDQKRILYANSIFQQPWWLDAVAPRQWHEIATKKNGSIVACLPYVIKKVWFDFVNYADAYTNIGTMVEAIKSKVC